jgi:arylsulfatase A-like enzyme
MKKILIRTLQAIAVGGLIGSVKGLAQAIVTISANDYFHFEMKHVAGKVLFNEILQWAITGTVAAAALVALVLAAWPVAWLLRRRRERAWGGALAAPVILGLLWIVGYWVNREFLPGLLTLPSIAANIAMIGASLGLWFLLATLFDRVVNADRVARFLSAGAIAAIPVVLILLVAGQLTKRIIPPSPPLTNKPNILVILIDTLRTDRMSVYGYSRQTTPHLEQLAADGVLFTQAISQASWTKPAVASLFTGMYPRQHGIASSDWGRTDAAGQTRVDTLSPKVQTIAEILSNAGYRTAAIGENNHLTPKTGFDQGFDYFRMTLDPDEYWTRAPETNQLFLRWLKRLGDDSFFAYLHYIDVHWPYRTPPPYSGMYASEPSEVDYNRHGFVPAHNDEPPAEFDPVVLQHMLDTYDEGIRFIDDKVGEIIEDLKQRGVYDQTLIVVTSDHGEEFREHGKLAHGQSLFDEIVRVPLIIKLPDSDGDKNAQVVTTQVELIDIMPTILHSIGLSAPEGLFGRHVFSTNLDPEPAAFSELDNRIAMRTSEHKYIYDFDSGTELLYDLISDPAEQENLAAVRPELAEELRGRLFNWIAVVDVGLSVRSEQVELDEDSKRRLEALGYVQ